MAGGDSVELKFRLQDGTDIGPTNYPPTTTVANLKESILAHWPPETENGPKTISDMKLINGGKVLDNSRTLADSKSPAGELLPGGIITMLVVVRPPSERATDNQLSGIPKTKCACTIM